MVIIFRFVLPVAIQHIDLIINVEVRLQQRTTLLFIKRFGNHDPNYLFLPSAVFLGISSQRRS